MPIAAVDLPMEVSVGAGKGGNTHAAQIEDKLRIHRVVAGHRQGSGARPGRLRREIDGENTDITGLYGRSTVRQIEAEIGASDDGMREIYLQRCATVVLKKQLVGRRRLSHQYRVKVGRIAEEIDDRHHASTGEWQRGYGLTECWSSTLNSRWIVTAATGVNVIRRLQVAFGATGAAHSVVSMVKRGSLETAEVSDNGAVPQFVTAITTVVDCPTRVGEKPRAEEILLGRQTAGASAFGSIFAAYPKLAVTSGGGGGTLGWNEPAVVCRVLFAIPATWIFPAPSAATACTAEDSVALPKYVENSNCFPVGSNCMMKPVLPLNCAGGKIDMKG